MKNYWNITLILVAALFLSSWGNDAWAAASSVQDKAGLHAQPWAFGYSSDRDSAIWNKGVDGDVVSRKKNSGANAVTPDHEKTAKTRANMGLSFKDETGTWKVNPTRKDMRPDEKKVRDNRHVLRAYAGVDATDDLNISVGPELILKDETRGDEAARADQPDTVFGMGMNFKYDF